MTWEYHRTPDFDVVVSAWAAGRPVVLRGPSGIGKTTLARQFAQTLGRKPLWIIGRSAMTDTPLAALETAVPIEPSDGSPEIVAKLRKRIAGGAIVVVESADQLDSASAAVVARLFSSLCGVGVVTSRGSVDPQLQAALDQAGACTISLAALDLDTTTAMTEARLGGALQVPDAFHIHRISEGNPFFLIEVVDGALRSGGLLRGADGVWELLPGAALGEDLRELGRERLAAASVEERRLIDLLTLCEPLPRAVADHLGLAKGISHAERELVLPFGDTLVSGHAVFTEVRRGELGALERRHLAVELVDALAAAPSEGSAVGSVHRARLCLEFALPIDSVDLADSAAVAFLLGDLTLAARLATAAVEEGAGLSALLQLSRAKSGLGEAAQALDVLSGLEPDSMSEADLAGYGITVAINHTVAGEQASAVDILDKFEPRLQTSELRRAFAAVRGLALVNAGAQWAALRWARAAQQPPADRLWTTVGEQVEAEALRRLGEVRRPIALIRRSLEGFGSSSSLAATGARRTLVRALLSDGDLPGARQASGDLLEATLLQHTPHAVACGTAALVEKAGGRFAAARRYCQSALDALDENDRTGLGRGVALVLAVACALTGDVEGAKSAAATAKRDTKDFEGWHGINPVLAEAAVQMAEGEVTRPVTTLRSVAAVCLAEDQLNDGMTALHWAVRFGDLSAARLLVEVAKQCEGRLTRVQGAHAAALVAGDPTGLVAVSAEFERLGFLPSAVDALAQAINLYRVGGNVNRAAALLDRFTSLRDRCEGMSTPAIRMLVAGASLTQRENEVLSLSTSGLRVAVIADRLSIAPETVRSIGLRAKRKQQCKDGPQRLPRR